MALLLADCDQCVIVRRRHANDTGVIIDLVVVVALVVVLAQQHHVGWYNTGWLFALLA